MKLAVILKSLSKNLVHSLMITSFIITSVYAQSADDNNSLGLTTLQQPTMTPNDDDNQVAVPKDLSLDPNKLFPKPSRLDQQTYEAVARQAMPMTPYQINKLKRMLAVTKEAASSPAGTPPQPVTSSIMVSLAPGATPPVILLQEGFISSLVFVDATGQKWPIEAYDLGDPNAFNIQWQQDSNMLLIQASTLFTYGNLAVKLKGLTTPVMLTLVPGQQTVDYRVDIHVQGQSPDAPAPTLSGLPAPVSNQLLDVLNGIPPTGSTTLQVVGGSCNASLNNCQAWANGNNLYVRIPMDILSPSWISKMQSSDGMRAYEMEKTPSLLVSDYGNTAQLKIEGF
ncbi:MAG: hypothetical protein A3E87_02330 [Gammaproteobacteria bacterium RIFCSPHIGHO2_12_FULL_35_23]|nr:MAG: hypothetical protein A3E87_02330 [Gammaproteobacteria bacterium RIFCSPHIGHO2_12_FULL_35_23]